MKVIGCGFPRTGTISTKLALEELGYMVYHGEENGWFGHSHLWADILDHPEDSQKLDAMIEEMLRLGYTSNLDFPSIHFCVDMYKRFPNAKVLLNVRDSANQWFRSFQSIGGVLSLFVSDAFPMWILKGDGYGDMVFRILKEQKMQSNVTYVESMFPWVNGRFVDFREDSVEEESAKRSYLRHIENVKENVPEDKLLIFNVKEGWDPLIKFLEVDDETVKSLSTPFPRKNPRGSWFLLKKLAWFLIYTYPFLLLIDSCLICFVVVFFWKTVTKTNQGKNEKRKEK